MLPSYSGVLGYRACPAKRTPFTSLVLKHSACAQEAASWRDFRASLVHQERAGLFTIDDSSRRLSFSSPLRTRLLSNCRTSLTLL